MKKGLLLAGFLSVFCLTAEAASAQNMINCFRRAYANYIKEVIKDPANGNVYFIMKDGQKVLWDDGKVQSFLEALNNPTLKSTMRQQYPLYASIDKLPGYNFDPGRYRNQQFFKAIYGNSAKAVRANLVKVRWLAGRSTQPKYLMFNKQNGAAQALARVSQALDKLPKSQIKYLTNLGGTFKWRKVAGTNYLSAHSYGISLDINVKKSNYWRWSKEAKKNPKKIPYKNKIPADIVKIFEKNGFVWGGRWYHYDTMHFEYRPEFMTCSH